MQMCSELNLPHPETYFVKDNNIAELSRNIQYPVILKPCIGSGSRGIRLIKNSNELVQKYPLIEKEYGKLIIQEYIPHGGAFGVEMLFDSKGLVCKFVHKRLREYPTSGGPSTYRISTTNKFMESVSYKLVQELNWKGPVMVEFRVDSRDKIPKIMEVNGRYWGSLRCSIAAGVNFPKYHYISATNGENKFRSYNKNICARWEVGEIMWLIFSEGNFFDKLRVVSSRLRNSYFDFLTKDDPLPFFISLLEASSYLFSKKGREHSISRGW